MTAYAPPVTGEDQTLNNIVTKFVTVTIPLINPVEGQWASYKTNYYDDMGRITGTEYWNLTYDHYVEPYNIYITLQVKDRYGYNFTGWMIINTMTRFVESGIWIGMWYPGWIETDINLGSPVNLLSGIAFVNGSKIVPAGVYPIDCWELPFGTNASQYTFWYDKVSGLWIGMDYAGYPSRTELRLTDTNIPIGTSFEHELAATVEAPVLLQPNDTSLINATAYNIGLSAETNVKLSVLIDSIEVESTIVPTLPSGTSHTISYIWKPTTEATYEITAYVEPVAEEAYLENNAVTKSVRVRLVKGYVLFDQTHWTDSILMYSMLVENITDRGYVVDTLIVSPLTTSALQGYDVFVIPQAHISYGSDEISAIQSFVLNGGGLLVIGDDLTYAYSDLTRFAGITWEFGGNPGYTNDITPHPVTEGVNTAYFESPVSKLFVSLPAQGLIRDLGKNILLAVSEIGGGSVIAIADENTIVDFTIGYADNLRLANNVIDWLSNKWPIVSFSCSPLDPYVGEKVSFDGSSSYDPDGTIVNYLWSFGDGDTASGATTTHVYAAGGTFMVALTAIDNEGLESTATANVTVARTTLEISVEVGSIYFRGEVAEFYVLVSSLGNPVDAEITAVLHHGGTIYKDLSSEVAHVGTGLYRIPYTVPADAFPGTYALVVEVNYLTLRGVALESFLLSSTLTGWNPLLVAVNGTLGTLKTDTGLIKVQLDAINAKLVGLEGNTATISSTIGTITADVASIQLEITSIDGTTVTIQTALGTIEGTITSIEGDVATIKTDIGTTKANLPSAWTVAQLQTTTPLYVVIILVLVIAIVTIILTLFRRKKS